MALIHHPVIGKSGETIAAAVTNLDLHDIARTARTYGVKSFFVVTPVAVQQELVQRIVDHWVTGAGGAYNPQRREALKLVTLAASLEEACQAVTACERRRPKIVVTSARSGFGGIGYEALRAAMTDGEPYVLTFGTAWGLAPEVIERADYALDPIVGNTDYNHLAVRSAAAIVLDRLVGNCK